MVNPAYYGLEDTDPGTLSSYLSRWHEFQFLCSQSKLAFPCWIFMSHYLYSLVLSTFEDLEDSGCIEIDEDRVEPMILGSIASQYYLRYTTVSMFASNIEDDTSLEVSYAPWWKQFQFSLPFPIFKDSVPSIFCFRFSSTYLLVLLNMMSFLCVTMK